MTFTRSRGFLMIVTSRLPKIIAIPEQDVTIRKCKLDFDDGVKLYDVEFRNAEGYEYEYEIDAGTGKILDKDVELDD